MECFFWKKFRALHVNTNMRVPMHLCVHVFALCPSSRAAIIFLNGMKTAMNYDDIKPWIAESIQRQKSSSSSWLFRCASYPHQIFQWHNKFGVGVVDDSNGGRFGPQWIMYSSAHRRNRTMVPSEISNLYIRIWYEEERELVRTSMCGLLR